MMAGAPKPKIGMAKTQIPKTGSKSKEIVDRVKKGAVTGGLIIATLLASNTLKRVIVNDEIDKKLGSKIFQYASEYKAKGDPILFSKNEIDKAVEILNQRAKPNVIFFFDGSNIDRIILPKYVITTRKALGILPQKSQERIQLILKKIIFENLHSKTQDSTQTMVDYLKILQTADYNKLERKLGKENALYLQKAIKEEISKLSTDKQLYLKNICKDSTATGNKMMVFSFLTSVFLGILFKHAAKDGSGGHGAVGVFD
ncbi:MAG: hypothetical protein WCX82_02035 [archaeon]|jgi:hypothetical protein